MPTCSTVTYRSFEDRDFDAAAELFFRQWCCGGDERLGRLDAQVNLCTYLMDVTWGVVAEPVPGRGSGEGDGLLGVLLVAAGAADHERPVRSLAGRSAGSRRRSFGSLAAMRRTARTAAAASEPPSSSCWW